VETVNGGKRITVVCPLPEDEEKERLSTVEHHREKQTARRGR